MRTRTQLGFGWASMVKGLGFTVLASAAMMTFMRESHRAALHSQILGNLEAINGVMEVCAMEHRVGHGDIGYCTAPNLGKDYLMKGWPEPLFSSQAATENGFKAADNQFAVTTVGAPPTYLGHDYSWWKNHGGEAILYRPVTEWLADYARATQSLGSQAQALKQYTPDNLQPVINTDPDYDEKVKLKKELLKRIADHNAEVEKKMMNSLGSKKPTN